MSGRGGGDALPRVALVCDLAEEGWHSMDLVAGRLFEHLRAEHAHRFRPLLVRPRMVRRAERLPWVGRGRHAALADRLANRFWDYPRELRRLRRREDGGVFHVVDHSYGQLVRELPAERTVIGCHDLEAFRCLLEPARDPRPGWYRRMAGRQLEGIRAAARVVCGSETVRREVLAYGLVAEERLRVVPYGIDPACRLAPDPAADAEAERLLGPPRPGAVELLSVSSTVPRKRLDVLLRVFAEVRREFPAARLLRVGGELPPALLALRDELGIGDALVSLPFLSREALGAVYRRAALVLQTSEAEGFGLPVAEAMACGTPVVASALPVLAEVGGEEAAYCPVGDVEAWSRTVAALLEERGAHPERWAARRAACAARGARFSWPEHARSMAEIYAELLPAR